MPYVVAIGEELVISMSMTEKSLSNIPKSKVIGVDIYNFSTTGDTGRTLSTAGGGYCYRKTSHPRNAEEPQGYEDTEIADTLNIFDYTEARTPLLIVEVRSGRDNAE